MGQCSGKEISPCEKAKDYDLNALQISGLLELMGALNLSWAEVDRFHAAFRMLDLDGNSCIGRDEFLKVVGCDPTDFALEIYTIFDRNQDSKMDFVEFLGGCTKVCVSDHDALSRFAFRMVDQNGSGKLDSAELSKVLSIIYGAKVESSDMQGLGWRHYSDEKRAKKQASVEAALEVGVPRSIHAR